MTQPKTNENDRAEERRLQRVVRAHPILTGLAGALVVMSIVAVLIWWLNARHYESTDDAFIDSRTVSISSEVNGKIVEVPVTDNQNVAEGAVLVRIDPRDFQTALDQANAQEVQAQASIANLDAQTDAQQTRIDEAGKQLAEAQSALTFARQENDRYQQLLKTGAGTQQRAQQAASVLRQQEATTNAAEGNLTAAKKQIGIFEAQREGAVGQRDQAIASAKQAEVNLSRTVISAPEAGRVTRLTASKGTYAEVGRSLMMFVPRQIWITANFKETQLVDMRPGQRVEISIDAFPDRSFYGHVDSIQAGSGTAFSTLPAENATGNFVKVVQRIPVKIVFDTPPDILLGPGMSIVASVRVR